jgi:phosphatidylglycerol lysyltransferase
MSSVLISQVHLRHPHIVIADAQLTLLAGLTLIYLANSLRRGKHTAWLISLPIFIYIVLRNTRHYFFDIPDHAMHHPATIILNVIFPITALAGLVVYRHLYTVRSELRSFAVALRWAAIILLVAFVYGTLGFKLMDERDFHQEISVPTAAHYTVDQFNITTDKHPQPATRRAQLFMDSLALVSVGSLFYVVVSLFAPIRFRLASPGRDSEIMKSLMTDYPASSEDFFKVWPHDKAYFFTRDHTAGLAYHVSKGIALVVGGLAGKKESFMNLFAEFNEYCRLNDWDPAFVYVEATRLYEDLGFELQKIGEEAIVSTPHFIKDVLPNKYFRHITNKFEKAGFTTELLQPPHSLETFKSLRAVSLDWLTIPGRAERGFMMGYFNDAYMQQGPIMVAKDQEGTIKAFINRIPSYNKQEANYDFLRHTKDSPGNVNDYLLSSFIKELHEEGIPRLNMGLCPLSGLDDIDPSEKSALDSVFSFVYSNGNRIYSFKGLKRFKAKYEPEWQDRYIAYHGGVRGFTRSLNGLRRAMRVPKIRLHT